MALFGSKKKEEEVPQAGGDFSMPPPPDPNAGPQAGPQSINLVDQVVGMRQQGYNNDQIVQSLQSQGMNAQDIFDAMNQADQAMGFQPQGMPPPQMAPQGQDTNRERIEQVAEAIIEEKWNTLAKDLNRVIEWKDSGQKEIEVIKQEIKDLKDRIDSLNQAILGKISEYDKNLVDVGTEIKAMEKVFQKILPTFTENVNKLDRITQGMGPRRKV